MVLELSFVNNFDCISTKHLTTVYSVPLMIVNLVAHVQSVSFAQYDIFQNVKQCTSSFCALLAKEIRLPCSLLFFVTAHDTVWKVLRLLVFTRKVTLFERGSYRLQRGSTTINRTIYA